jgi:hypothetical protein
MYPQKGAVGGVSNPVGEGGAGWKKGVGSGGADGDAKGGMAGPIGGRGG